MNHPNPKNACTNETHDFEPSKVAAMVNVCAWCGEERDVGAAVLEGVDIPRGTFVVVARARVAA